MSQTDDEVDRIQLASVAELEQYSALVAAELAGAESALDSAHARPFAGTSAEVMRDVDVLRAQQLGIFQSHVEIEQRYRVPRPGTETADVRDVSFSSIAGAMREKETATSELLGKLDAFDASLRRVIGKFETTMSGGVGEPGHRDVGHAAGADRGATEDSRRREHRPP